MNKSIPEAVLESVARAICMACEENPDHQGDARGNEFRWQDYRDAALAAISAFTAAQKPAEYGCHCGTCTCNPNMTPAVRFDLSPAQMEGAIRDHLIALGWTPPGAQQPVAVDEAKETDLWRCTVCGQVGTVGRCCGEETREPLAPPSAPVGVDFAAVASILRRAMRDGVHYGYRRDFILQQALALEAIAQQPAAAQPDWEVAPPGATHYQPHQGAYYKRVSASEWYVWSRVEDRELLRWLPSPGTSDSSELVVRPADALAQQPAAVDGLAARLVDELDGLVGESYGASGLHLNGCVATWDELLPGGRFERLSSLDELRAALAAQQGGRADG